MIDAAGMVLAAAGSFVGTHFALSHPLRRPLVRQAGRGRVQRSLLGPSPPVTLGATAWAYWVAPITAPAWDVGDGLWALATAVMLVASILLLGSLVRNPALVGAAKQAAGDGTGARRLRHHPPSDDVGLRPLGRQSHPRIPDCQEHRRLGCDHRPVAGRGGVSGSEKGPARLAGLDCLARPHELSALRCHRSGPSEVRLVRTARHFRRPARLASGDVGTHAAGGMAGRHLALALIAEWEERYTFLPTLLCPWSLLRGGLRVTDAYGTSMAGSSVWVRAVQSPDRG